jgi:hypothetical protein
MSTDQSRPTETYWTDDGLQVCSTFLRNTHVIKIRSNGSYTTLEYKDTDGRTHGASSKSQVLPLLPALNSVFTFAGMIPMTYIGSDTAQEMPNVITDLGKTLDIIKDYIQDYAKCVRKYRDGTKDLEYINGRSTGIQGLSGPRLMADVEQLKKDIRLCEDRMSRGGGKMKQG